VPLSELSTPEGYERALARAASYYGEPSTPVERAASASLLTGDVASALAVPLATALVVHRRALVLRPDDVLVQFGTLGIEAVAAPWPRLAVAVLPSDPLAGLPDAQVVLDLTAIRTAAATSFAACVGPLVAVTSGAARRGPGALRGELAERLSAAVALACRAVKDDESAPAEAAALLGTAPRWLRVPMDWVDVPFCRSGDVEGSSTPWKRRRVCCLAYQTPRFAGELCATCPRVPREETVDRLSSWLSQAD
jgi:hypothetical protein